MGRRGKKNRFLSKQVAGTPWIRCNEKNEKETVMKVVFHFLRGGVPT